MVGHLADVITYAKFQYDIFSGYDFTGVEFPILLLIFAWVLQQFIATALPVIGLRLPVCQCVRLWALSRSHILIDFHPNWHRHRTPNRKNEFVRGSISHNRFPYFVPQNRHFRPRGPENPCKY